MFKIDRICPTETYRKNIYAYFYIIHIIIEFLKFYSILSVKINAMQSGNCTPFYGKERMRYRNLAVTSESVAKIGGGNASMLFGNTLCGYAPDSFVTKQALCRLFGCTDRTLRRMVARRDLPPPDILNGKNVWRAGLLGAWLADAAERKQAQINADAARLRAMMTERWAN